MSTKPQCVIVPESRRYPKKAIRHLEYEGKDLLVRFQGEKWVYTRLVFRSPVGIRILNESDVLEYWNEYSEPNGWLWEVLSGGWLDLERTRRTFNTIGRVLREYFIADEICVNVLCADPPKIEFEDLGGPPRCLARARNGPAAPRPFGC